MCRSGKIFALLALIAASCTKNDDPPPVPDSPRLTEIRHTNNFNGHTLQELFEYDLQGRVTKMRWQAGGYVSPYTEPFEISYPDAQTVMIKFPARNDRFATIGVPPFEKTVVFRLDGEGRPLARFEKSQYKLDPLAELKRSLRLDTTYYKYGSGGLLESTIRRYFDSVYTPVAGISRQSFTDTTYYTNKNGNLEGGRSTGYDTIIQYIAGPIPSVIFKYVKTLSLDYQEQWPMGNYGKNAIIYHELGVFAVKAQQIGLPYRNLANRSEESRNLFDLAGNSRGGSARIEEINTTSTQFNDLNLITRLTFEDAPLGREYLIEFIYSR